MTPQTILAEAQAIAELQCPYAGTERDCGGPIGIRCEMCGEFDYGETDGNFLPREATA